MNNYVYIVLNFYLYCVTHLFLLFTKFLKSKKNAVQFFEALNKISDAKMSHGIKNNHMFSQQTWTRSVPTARLIKRGFNKLDFENKKQFIAKNITVV